MRARYGMSVVSPKSNLYHALVITFLYEISCYNKPCFTRYNIYPAHVIAIRYVMARNNKPRWRISHCIRKTSHIAIQTFMKIHGTCMKRPMHVIQINMLLLYVRKLPIYTMKNTMPAHCLYNYNEAAILVHKWWQSKWHRISLVKNKTIV